MGDVVKNVILLILIFTSFLSAQNINRNFYNKSNNHQWQFANGPYEATLYSISFDPINPNIIYTTGESVFRSTNSGDYWNEIEPDTLLLSASIETVIKADPNISGLVYYGGHGALFKSFNYGDNWEIIGFENRKVSSIEIDPTNSEIIYIGLDNSSNDAVWKSTDGGETWEIKTNGIPVSQLPLQNCKEIKINPLNNNSIIAAISSEGVYKSVDGSNKWIPLWELNQPIEDVEILLWDTTTILLAAGGLYKSTNNGLNWIQIFNVGASCLDLDSNSQDIYYGFYRTSDKGITWDSLINPNLPSSFSLAININDIVVKPGDSNVLYAATGAGIYKSTNKGENWTQNFEGLNKFYAYDIKISLSNPSIIYAVGREGIHRSNDTGNSWKYIGGGAAENYIAIDPTNPDIVYIAHVPILIEYWLWRTTNGGEIWEKKLTSQTRFDFIEIDPINYSTLYSKYTDFTQSVLCKSTDRGDTWEFLNTPVAPTSILISKQSNHTFYIGSRDGVYKTIDGGINWIYIGLNENANILLSFAPEDEKIIYAALYGNGIYKTTNSGLNWEEKNNGLTSNKFTQLIVNPKIPGQIFVGFEDNGIYFSNNYGENWNTLEPEHPSILIDAICIDTTTSGRILAAGREAPGIYTLDLSPTNVEYPAPDEFTPNFFLYQNYPNPFNSNTIIKFSLPYEGNVKLEVYDLLGRKINTLINEYKPSGEHSILWDGKNEKNEYVNSGLYLYRIYFSGSFESKKMIYLK